MIEKNKDLQFYIRDTIKKINSNFVIIFSSNFILVSYKNDKNIRGSVLSFIEIIKILMKFNKVEQLLLNRKIILNKHKTIEIDNFCVKVGFSLI